MPGCANFIRRGNFRRHDFLLPIALAGKPNPGLAHLCGLSVDFISALLVSLVRDLVCQGTGMLLVRTFSGGSLVADRCGTCVIESEIRRINGMLYMQGNECHMEWWAVFGLGAIFWLF